MLTFTAALRGTLLVGLLALGMGMGVSAALAQTTKPGPAKARATAKAAPAAVDRSSDGALLDSIENENRLIADSSRTEIQNELKRARSRMAQEPVATRKDLELALERVAKAPEFSTAARAELRGQLEAAIRECKRASSKLVLEEDTQKSRSQAAENSKATDDLQRRQLKASHLIDRYQSLVEAGKYNEATALAAEELPSVVPNMPAAVSAPQVARFIGDRSADLALRSARAKGVYDAYAAEHTASIPAGDQPITYPNLAVWQKLTDYRRAQGYIDGHKPTPAETKINQALKETTSIDFQEATPSEVAEYFSDLHGINVEVDHDALVMAGLASDATVTKKLKNITLRSALRHTLSSLDLTYMIKDEVLVITTPMRASQELVRRIYYVGDMIVGDPRDLPR